MNILLINHYAGSKIHGMEYRPFYLAKEWVKSGHQVTILAASFSHLRNRSPNIIGNITEEKIEGIHYIWIKTPSYQGNGPSRMLNMLTFAWRLLSYKKKLVPKSSPNIVIASSPQPFIIFGAYIIARKTNSKLIFEVRDLWPASLIELGGLSPWHPLIRLMQWTEKFAYRVSNRVVSLLPKAYSYMRQQKMAPHKFTYIPNGIDVTEWQSNRAYMPQEHERVLSELKKNNRFIIGYAGAHGIANGLHSLIEAAKLLQENPVTLVLVGEGSEKKILQQKKICAGLKNIVFLPPVQRAAIPKLLATMDVFYIGLQKKNVFCFGVSPNKLIDYMMANKPVLYAIEAGNDLVAESGCGISIPPERPEAIASAVLHFMAMSPSERDTMGLRGKEYVLANHDYTALAKKFELIMV